MNRTCCLALCALSDWQWVHWRVNRGSVFLFKPSVKCSATGDREMRIIVLLICFWVFQVTANVFFKMGGDMPSRWWWCFVLGNVVGISSIYFMMRLYARMDANMALALAGGGAFIAVQVALALVFGGRPTMAQWLGFVLVAAGMALSSLGAKPQVRKMEVPADAVLTPDPVSHRSSEHRT
jgi:drug/metabolite transporter (DMT)-like permease